ncbi:hypothetical protein AXF42_Ash001920 [Apostasia shenzhenica]|uniref:Uncharacterized protein n=1 Tax=Apostasia shenzhenica TaxID=1088818 RepID=A0A2I0ABM2_9ASPA|nr:hypothetical protein AXF42_Ash001920 [Apostasia shenzhenica]
MLLLAHAGGAGGRSGGFGGESQREEGELQPSYGLLLRKVSQKVAVVARRTCCWSAPGDASLCREDDGVGCRRKQVAMQCLCSASFASLGPIKICLSRRGYFALSAIVVIARPMPRRRRSFVAAVSFFAAAGGPGRSPCWWAGGCSNRSSTPPVLHRQLPLFSQASPVGRRPPPLPLRLGQVVDKPLHPSCSLIAGPRLFVAVMPVWPPALSESWLASSPRTVPSVDFSFIFLQNKETKRHKKNRTRSFFTIT